MFGIGWSELLLTLGVALCVIGPKELPQVLYQAGKLFRKVKLFLHDIQKTVDAVIQQEELDDIIRQANKPGGDNLNFNIEQQKAIEARDARTADRAPQDNPGAGS